ncbi:hypothetical protein U1Q18_027986, partial [Sarracenia purpurea var. burkii]
MRGVVCCDHLLLLLLLPCLFGVAFGATRPTVSVFCLVLCFVLFLLAAGLLRLVGDLLGVLLFAAVLLEV